MKTDGYQVRGLRRVLKKTCLEMTDDTEEEIEEAEPDVCADKSR